MAKKYTKEQILNKKIIDYTFVIVFFLVFSFFIFFAIKPNLETAFKLQRELGELKQIETNYDTAINTIINIQSAIVRNRDSVPFLEQALPARPELQKIVQDVQKVASESGFKIDSLNVVEVPVLSATTEARLKNFQVSFMANSDFAGVHNFITSFLGQRRLKSIDKVDITSKSGPESSGSAQLSVTFAIESYYL
jgi:Tfp pilus assembly protein PilO